MENKIQQTKKHYEIWIFGTIGAAVLGVLQFIVCVIVALNYYPEPFSLADNLITDLGKDANDYGMIFNISVIFMGVLLIPLFGMLPAIETRSSHSKYAVAISGIGSCLGLVLLGLLPNDIYFIEHVVALMLWAMPTVIAIMAFFYLVSNNPNMSTWFIATCLGVVIVTLILLFGSMSDNFKVLQRILLMYSLVWFAFLAFFAFNCGKLALANAMLDHVDSENLAEEYRYTLMSQDHRK